MNSHVSVALRALELLMDKLITTECRLERNSRFAVRFVVKMKMIYCCCTDTIAVHQTIIYNPSPQLSAERL